MLAKGLTPVVPSQGSVGASGDLAPLSHMAAAMIGVGEIEVGGQRLPAADALKQAGLAPLDLGPKEGLALLNGTQFSTANALAGLFRAETIFRSALITGALSTEAAKGSDAPFDPRIHALRGPAGPRDVGDKSEEHTSELQSLMRISYAVFCLKKKTAKSTAHITRQLH